MDMLLQFEIRFYWLWWLCFIAIGFCLARYRGQPGILGAAVLISLLIFWIEVNSVFKDMRTRPELGRDADGVFIMGVLIRIVLYNIFVLPFSILGWKRRLRRHQTTQELRIDFGTPVELKGKTRFEVIDELIEHLLVTNRIQASDRDAITKAVTKRESYMTTGIGFSVAVPHASTDSVSEIVGVFGRSETGIDFGSLDGKRVHRVALFLIPQGELHKYSHLLPDLAKKLHQNPGEFPFAYDKKTSE